MKSVGFMHINNGAWSFFVMESIDSALDVLDRFSKLRAALEPNKARWFNNPNPMMEIKTQIGICSLDARVFVACNIIDMDDEAEHRIAMGKREIEIQSKITGNSTVGFHH